MQKVVVGIDLGGTNVRAGTFYRDGTPAGPDYSFPSRAEEGAEAVFDAIARTVNQAISNAREEPVAMGLAIPGHVDDRAGTVRWAPNFGEYVNGVFQCWKDIPVRDALMRRLQLPVRMGNDANCAAFGEYQYGTGNGTARCLVMLTVGTGIGGGVILGSESVIGRANGPMILIGANGGGTELGHVVIAHNGLDCKAGTYGALEAYCQRDAIVMRAVHRLIRGRSSIIANTVEGDLSKVTPLIIAQAAEAGDELAIQVFREVGEMLGVGIGSFINTFGPDVVAVGGQIAKAGKFLLDPAISTARDVAVTSLFADATITVAKQIEDAGMLGAAALALMED